jgi:hypothetical protein
MFILLVRIYNDEFVDPTEITQVVEPESELISDANSESNNEKILNA